MKKILITIMLLLASLNTLCREREHYGDMPWSRWERRFINQTPFTVYLYISFWGLGKGHGHYIAPGETFTYGGDATINGLYVTVFTRYILPDSVRSQLEPTTPIKDKPSDMVEVYASSWIEKEDKSKRTGWIIDGPRCLSCTPKKSLFKYDEFKKAYDIELIKKYGTNKPTNHEELAAISAPLIQKAEFWHIPEALALAKRNGELVKKDTDPSKDVYYTYAAGQITDPTPSKYNAKTMTTKTFSTTRTAVKHRR